MAGALIGALRVSLSAETSAFEAGMKRSQRQAAQTASSIKGSFNSLKGALGAGLAGFIGGIGISSLIQAGKAALEYAGHLGELADTLGLTTKDLQTFSYAAGQVGISQEELQTGIQKLTISIGQAELGAKKQVAAFNAIGISVDQLRGKNAGDVFRMIAEKLETVSDRSQRAAIEVALFGKAGAKLDNLLSGSQGRLSELSDAAERLGIVLSDEQIQNADRTADKIGALQTVLKARIAGVVADNADSILGLADAIATLIGKLGTAIRAYQAFVAGMTILSGKIDAFDPTNSKQNKANARIRIAQGEVELQDLRLQQAGKGTAADRVARFKAAIGAGPAPAKPRAASGSVGQFLGGGGGGSRRSRGGGGGRADHTAEKLARDLYELQREELDAQRDILEAKKDLSSDYVEQTTLSVQILDNQREQYQAELEYKVKTYALSKGQDGITKAQADHLLAEYDIADSLKRQKLIQEEAEQRQRDTQMLVQHDFDRRSDILRSQEDIATTQSERRSIELELLRIAYEQKRQALQNILDTSKDEAAIEDARRDLINLKSTYANDRQGVMQRTAGPLENYLNSLPTTAAKWNEALQTVAVDGLKSIEDGLMSVLDGTKSVGSAFRDMAKGIISDLLRISIQRAIIGPLANALFGGGGGMFGGGGGLLGGLLGGAGGMTSHIGSYGTYASGVLNGSIPLSGVYATGGFVSGPGGPTSDSIPAMLSDGEFVVNAEATKKSLPLLRAINSGRAAVFASGGMVRSRNMPRINGLSIAEAKFGERLSIGNDNMPRGGGVTVHAPITITSPVSRETAGQLGRELNARIAQARTKGF